MIRLIAMTDDDFAWLLGQAERTGLTIVPGGVESAEVIEMLRNLARVVGAGLSHPVAWIIAHEGEVVGMTSLTKRVAEGRYEIGYGVAPSRAGSGYATAAVAELLVEARRLGIAGLTAETSTANPASQRVLEKNGFERVGTRTDEDDGELICWACELEANR